MNITKQLATAMLAGFALAATAQTAPQEEPIVTFHTSVYEIGGETNSFTFYVGSTEPTYIYVDCGFGETEVEVTFADFDPDQGGITGTPVTCTVPAEGIVKIYGEADKIDFLDLEGCYITDIQWPALTSMAILNLKHNELRSLDLSHMTALQALYVSDNPFTQATPLRVGNDKPELAILEMSMIGHCDPDFDINRMPKLQSFVSYSNPTLSHLDPTQCPLLRQLSIDGSAVSSLDLSQNPYLMVLNVSETRVTELDLSHNPLLTELYFQHEAWLNHDYKFDTIDLSHNPLLQRLGCNGNNLRTLDLTANTRITSLFCRRNRLASLSFDSMPDLTLVDVMHNDMDFLTTPAPRTTFSDYAYQQNAMPLDRQYAEGTTLDFTARVMRPGTVTSAVVYTFNRETAASPEIIDPEYYTWADGKVTLHRESTDSMYVAFRNTLFPDMVLCTTPFVVRKAADMGRPTPQITYPTSSLCKDQAFSVGIDGATADSPVEILVDFGDGTLLPFSVTTSAIPDQPNVTGQRKNKNTTFYAPEGHGFTAFRAEGMRLMGTPDFTGAPLLRELTIDGCNLGSTGLDLRWNRLLTHLNLDNNLIQTLDLSDPNSSYVKTQLGHISAANNRLVSLQMVDNYTLRNVNLAGNQLRAFNLQHATALENLDLSGNLLTELNLQDCEALTTLNLAGNSLTSLAIPDYTPLQTLDISGNALSIPSLALLKDVPAITYAPQQPVVIPTKAPSANLADQQCLIDGQTTQYEWRLASDDTPVATDDIRNGGNGLFFFDNPAVGQVYCSITHPALPQLAGDNTLRTTAVLTAEAPDNEFVSFTSSDDQSGTLVMTSHQEGTVVYLDLRGDGSYEQYMLSPDIRQFTLELSKDQSVRGYSYEEADGLKVFSIRAALTDIDASKMQTLECLGISGAGLTPEKVQWPQSPQLNEIIADGNAFTAFPAADFPNLWSLNLSNNRIETFDATPLSKLSTLYISGNGLRTLTLDNPKLWELAANDNALASIDLGNLPAMQQLWLHNNALTAIDITAMPSLRVLTLDNNRLDFLSLPLPSANFYKYDYRIQQPVEIEVVEGRVDLSRYATPHGQPTAYTWYIDTPYYDEEGNLAGEDLYEGEEYLLNDGVTTFLRTFKNIMCVMTHPLYPGLNLYTNFVDVNTLGIEEIVAGNDDTDTPAVYYNLQGQAVAEPLSGNVYLRRQGTTVTKVIQR